MGLAGVEVRSTELFTMQALQEINALHFQGRVLAKLQVC